MGEEERDDIYVRVCMAPSSVSATVGSKCDLDRGKCLQLTNSSPMAEPVRGMEPSAPRNSLSCLLSPLLVPDAVSTVGSGAVPGHRDIR